MAENNYPLRFNFIANVSDFNQKLGQVSGRLKSFSANVTRLGTTLSTRLTLPLAIAGGGAFKMAADFQESLNKVDVSFKQNAKEVKAWSKTTLKQFGMSQAQALETAALFGDMGTGMGQTTEQAAKMSINLSALSADLSSFKNIQQEVAQTALASVYTGETESLKKLGIVMTETNLAEFARNKGIKKNIKDMSQMEKVELRYQFVMDRTKNAQGDFARTSDSASNQLRTLKNTMIELGTKIGQILIPPITAIIGWVSDLANRFIALDGSTKAQIVTVTALAAALGPLLIVLGNVGKVMAFISSPIGLVIVGLTAIGAAFIYLKDNWDAVKERIGDWSWWKNMLIGMIQFLVKNNPFAILIKGINIVLEKLGKDPIPNPFEKFSDEYLEDLKDANVEYEHEFGTFKDALTNQLSGIQGIIKKIGDALGFSGTGPSLDTGTDPDDNSLNPDPDGKVEEKVIRLSDLFGKLGQNLVPELGQSLRDAFAAIAEGENPIKRLWKVIQGLVVRLLAAASAAAVLAFLLPGGKMDKVAKAAKFKDLFSGFMNFAKGGLVYGPTLAQVGEYPGARSNPEVIAPLSKLKRILGGTTGNKNMMVGEFVLRGQDLLMAVERATKNKNRFS